MSWALQPLRGLGSTGDESAKDEDSEGAHELGGLIGRAGVMAASQITPPKPIITRSSGWVRPETWTIHG